MLVIFFVQDTHQFIYNNDNNYSYLRNEKLKKVSTYIITKKKTK